jgi:hypothetical protein
MFFAGLFILTSCYEQVSVRIAAALKISSQHFSLLSHLQQKDSMCTIVLCHPILNYLKEKI